MSSNSRNSKTSSRYTAVSLTPDAAKGLRILAHQLSADLGRRVTLSEMTETLVRIAEEDPGALPEALAAVRRNR